MTALMVEDDDGWMVKALCRGADASLFFPEGAGPEMEAAKRICAVCPVKGDCLEFALRHNIAHGCWGGLSERERARLRKQRARESR